MTIFLTLNSALWGMQVSVLAPSFTLISGPFSAGDTGTVKTDLAGNIVAWSLTGSLPGLDMLSQVAMNGSGRDLVFGVEPGACGPPGQFSGACGAKWIMEVARTLQEPVGSSLSPNRLCLFFL
jgi:hypothetical protein